MKRALFAIVMLTGPVASAGTYFGLAIGPGIDTGSSTDFTASGRNAKLLVGYSIGQLSIEAAGMRGGLTQMGGRAFDGTQLSLAGKYSLPLSDGFEAFGRVGYQRTSVSVSGGDDQAGVNDADGTGLLLGAGIEFRLKLPVTSASIFLEYDYSSTTLNGPSFNAVNLDMRGFMLGATAGF